jgi:hypothetical protein
MATRTAPPAMFYFSKFAVPTVSSSRGGKKGRVALTPSLLLQAGSRRSVVRLLGGCVAAYPQFARLDPKLLTLAETNEAKILPDKANGYTALRVVGFGPQVDVGAATDFFPADRGALAGLSRCARLLLWLRVLSP